MESPWIPETTLSSDYCHLYTPDRRPFKSNFCRQMEPEDRHPDLDAAASTTVYVLELGGQDDDFAVFEAESAASGVERVAPGLATARGLTDRVRQLAYTRSASELLGRGDPDVESARSILSAASIERSGTVAVRAVDVRGQTGVDTQRAEREMGQTLVDRGFAVDLDDPDNELRVFFAEGGCAVGWLVAESVRDYGTRKPTDRPFFQPGSMDPLLARALANAAGARPGATVLDPMCGTGGILVEAGLVGAQVLGTDTQAKMVDGSRENLAHFLDGGYHVARGDARSLPVADGSVDAVVFDAPYGRQSKIEGQLDSLVFEALQEARRVAPRCIVVGDRPWAQPAHEAGWTTEAAFDRPVHRSLTRYVLALRRA
ncbi:MAG: tRNA (guanine10-N2)-dimethyltransferase [Haloarculaceae archaeon]|jgi:tRNA (guanine10-N2)-dimethyltransferase